MVWPLLFLLNRLGGSPTGVPQQPSPRPHKGLIQFFKARHAASRGACSRKKQMRFRFTCATPALALLASLPSTRTAKFIFPFSAVL
jgi:hypothetical protein